MSIRDVAAGAAVAVAIGVVPSAAVGADTMAQPTYKRYATCAKMHKDHPRGIAHPKARIAKNSRLARLLGRAWTPTGSG